MSVVFPAPLGPSKPKNSPSSTVRSTPASACTAPKRRATLTISTAGVIGRGRQCSSLLTGLQEILDAVELSERLEARRHVDERKLFALGRSATPPGEQDRDPGGVHGANVGERNDARRG